VNQRRVRTVSQQSHGLSIGRFKIFTTEHPVGADAGVPVVWAGLSVAAALLSMIGSIVGLLAPNSLYGKETSSLADAATAQDLVGLVIVGPLLLVLAVLAVRGSLRCWLCWLGLLLFTVYNYAIYAFSINFGPLFLVWVAVLGLALFALIGGLAALGTSPVETRLAAAPVRLTGWFLIVIATLFVMLWLSEIAPDLLAGRASTSAEDWKVPTNPVHVLDLAFFLPAVFLSGVLLLRRHRLGYATAPAQLIFLGLTCLPILITPPSRTPEDTIPVGRSWCRSASSRLPPWWCLRASCAQSRRLSCPTPGQKGRRLASTRGSSRR
jgi:hypothetical protein